MSQVTLTVESKIQNVALVAVAVHGICEHLGADPIEASEMELCVTEAVTNAIQHAYQNDGSRVVTVTVIGKADGIQCEVCDQGLCMPAADIETLTKGRGRAAEFDHDNRILAEHGRGLRIIASLMDEVAYLHDSANCLRMKKRIRKFHIPGGPANAS